MTSSHLNHAVSQNFKVSFSHQGFTFHMWSVLAEGLWIKKVHSNSVRQDVKHVQLPSGRRAYYSLCAFAASLPLSSRWQHIADGLHWALPPVNLSSVWDLQRAGLAVGQRLQLFVQCALKVCNGKHGHMTLVSSVFRFSRALIKWRLSIKKRKTKRVTVP